MILYHGSNLEIENISLDKCRPYKDFGKGFYLTSLYQQAWKMAVRVSKIYGGKPCVSVFEVPDNVFENTELNCLQFGNKVSKEWAVFVNNNRNRAFNNFQSLECNLDCKYDIVVGPIADDDLALLFRQFANEFINLDMLVEGMRYKELTNQYSFHTDKAINFLSKVGVEYE